MTPWRFPQDTIGDSHRTAMLQRYDDLIEYDAFL